MKNLINYYSPFFIRVGGLILLYTFIRFLFYWFNSELFTEINLTEWLNIILGGLRFDLSIIIYINLIFILLWILPFQLNNNFKVRKFLYWYFIFINSFALIFQLADLVYYPFNGKRIDIEVLGLMGTLKDIGGQFVNDYWYVFALYFLMVWVIVKLYSLPKEKIISLNIITRIIFFLLAGFVALLGMRGGFTNPRPLSPASATFHSSPQNLALVTNSVYTFLYSYVNRNLEAPNYFSKEDLKLIYPVLKNKKINSNKTTSMLIENKPNIVLLIMESFSKSYVGELNGNKGYTPYLDTLISENTSCINAFANGRRSSQGLASLTTGIPALMNEPYMHSSFLGNKIEGVPSLLSNEGYQTAFFNGSKRNMLGWEEFISNSGYENYYSRESYNNDEHHDGNWGIYDHYMFNFLKKVIDSSTTPFYYTFFSLSSHLPFNIPPELENQFSDNGSAYFNALKYADWSLGQFFQKAKKEKWFRNTIFIITADHTLYGELFDDEKNSTTSSMYQNRVGLYAIPIVIINPFDTINKTIEKVVSHVDISETILNFGSCKTPHISWGNDIYSSFYDNTAIQFVNGIYQIENKEFVLLFDGEKNLGLYKYKEDVKLEKNLIKVKEYEELGIELENKLKGAIQQHHLRMINNSLFVN